MGEKYNSQKKDRILDSKVKLAIDEKYGDRGNIASELIDALRCGDESAFEKLYTHMGGPIEDFLNYILRSREDAREMTQEVFAYVWENREKIKSNKNFKGYLYIAARNFALQLLRRRKMELKYLEMEIPLGDGMDYSPDDLIAARETEMLIRLTLETMPEKQRRAFEMSRYEGLDADEIAKKLGLTKSTVQVYISNALKEIAEITFLVMLFLSS